MNVPVEPSAVVQAVTALLVLIGASFTLIGTLGLLRLSNFYQRVHAPTLGTTLGTISIALASLLYFSGLSGHLVAHEVLIVAFITVTTPVSLIVLVRAAHLRDTFAKSAQDRN